MSSSFLLPGSSGSYRGWREGFWPRFARAANSFRLAVCFRPASALTVSGGPDSVPNLVRDHPVDLGRVGLAHQCIGIELAFALGVLRSKDMALERFAALDLARRGLLEAFCCAFVCFQFRHIFFRRLSRLANGLQPAASCRLAVRQMPPAAAVWVFPASCCCRRASVSEAPESRARYSLPCAA